MFQLLFLQFASKIIGKTGPINVSLGYPGFNYTIKSKKENVIILNDVINAFKLIEDSFTDFCVDSGIILFLDKIEYYISSNTYEFKWIEY